MPELRQSSRSFSSWLTTSVMDVYLSLTLNLHIPIDRTKCHYQSYLNIACVNYCYPCRLELRVAIHPNLLTHGPGWQPLS